MAAELCRHGGLAANANTSDSVLVPRWPKWPTDLHGAQAVYVRLSPNRMTGIREALIATSGRVHYMSGGNVPRDVIDMSFVVSHATDQSNYSSCKSRVGADSH